MDINWTDIIVALITVIGGAIIGFIINELKSNRCEQKALKILLRRELREQYKDWSELGYISSLGLQEYTDAETVYMSLVGNNDFIKVMNDKILELPIKD